MKNLILFIVICFSITSQARPLNCIVSFIDGGTFQDFVAPKTTASKDDYTQYALLNKNGFSFYANEYKSNIATSSVLSLMIVQNEKTHLGTSPVLLKGQRACLTVDLGHNEHNESVKVAISCEAL